MGEGERKKDGVCAEADTWWRADYNYREMVGFRAEKAVREVAPRIAASIATLGRR